MRHSLALRDTPRLSNDGVCIRCGLGETRDTGPLVFTGGEWIHYARCLNRALAPPAPPPPLEGEERIEAATAAPGEMRNTTIPKKKRQAKRPQSFPRDA